MKTLIAAAMFGAVATTPVLAQETVEVGFVNGEGQDNGTAELTATPAGVLIKLEITGLPAGEWVGFHVHETGSCDHTTGHDSAGGHFNPTSREHGYLAAKGPHVGDMPNQYVAADGVLRGQVLNSAITLDKGEKGVLGRALMIHANPDDYQTQPTGGAGARLACGVIE